MATWEKSTEELLLGIDKANEEFIGPRQPLPELPDVSIWDTLIYRCYTGMSSSAFDNLRIYGAPDPGLRRAAIHSQRQADLAEQFPEEHQMFQLGHTGGFLGEIAEFIGSMTDFWIIQIIGLMIFMPVAFRLDKSLRKRVPSANSYKWGYCIGLAGMLSSVAAILQFLAASYVYGSGSRADTFTTLSIIFLIALVAHFFIIKRNRWAWIIGIVLQLNPVLWIINGVYLRNRWTELSSLSVRASTSQLNNYSLANRILIAGSAFWAFVVLAFVFAFEPYGNRIEWWQVIKIIIFPPLVAVVGYFLYSRVIRLEHNKLP